MGVNYLPDAVVRVLERAGKALTKSEIINEVVGDGFDRGAALAAWGAVRDTRAGGRMEAVKDGRTTRYQSCGEPLSPAQAFERLIAGRLSKADRALIEIVRSGLDEMHFARAMAEMAIEVEELTGKQATARAIIHRVRARMKRMRLEPIDQAGDEVAFDRHRHQPIGSDIRDGTSVRVVRPGYVWKTPAKDVLVERAVVQE